MADVVRRFTVDGELFRVRLHDDGGFDCEWLSGPNPGYGFWEGAPVGYTVRGAGAGRPVPADRRSGPADDDDHVTESIRVFLAMIDPATGYIGD